MTSYPQKKGFKMMDSFKISKSGWSFVADQSMIRFAYDRLGGESPNPESCFVLDREMVENLFYMDEYVNRLLLEESEGGLFSIKSVTIGRDVSEERGRLFLVIQKEEEDYRLGFSYSPTLSPDTCFSITLDAEVILQLLNISDLICSLDVEAAKRKIIQGAYYGELNPECGFDEEDWDFEPEDLWDPFSDANDERFVDENFPRVVPCPFTLTSDWLRLYPEEGGTIQIEPQDVDFWEFVISVVESFEGADSGGTSGRFIQKGRSRSLHCFVDQLDTGTNDKNPLPFYGYRVNVIGENLFEVNMTCVGGDDVREQTITGSCDFFSAISAVTSRLMIDMKSFDSLDDEPELVDDDDEEVGA